LFEKKKRKAELHFENNPDFKVFATMGFLYTLHTVNFVCIKI